MFRCIRHLVLFAYAVVGACMGVRAGEPVSPSPSSWQAGGWLEKLAAVGSGVEDRAQEAREHEELMARALDHLCVQMSLETLQGFASRPIQRTAPVQLTVLGVPLSGQARLIGKTEIRLIPDSERAVVDLVLSGTARSRTQGQAGLVRIHADGTTRFTVSKRLTVQENGIEGSPARCRAETRSTVTHVSSDVRGIRGRLLRRIGLKQARAQQVEVDRITSYSSQTDIQEYFDRELNALIRQANAWLAEVRRADGGNRRRMHFASSHRCLSVRWQPTGRPADQPPLGPPEPPRRRSVAVHVPVSAVDGRLLATALTGMLSGYRSSSLEAALGKMLPARLLTGGLDSLKPNMSVSLSPDGEWLGAEFDLAGTRLVDSGAVPARTAIR